MTISEKMLLKLLSGKSDNGFRFAEIDSMLIGFGFQKRVKGAHHIYWKEGVDEILNLQPKGKKAKAYQVKQIRDIIVKYGFGV